MNKGDDTAVEQCGFSGTFQEGADSCDEFKSLRICVCGRVEQGFSNVCLLASWCSQASSISSLLFVIVLCWIPANLTKFAWKSLLSRILGTRVT